MIRSQHAVAAPAAAVHDLLTDIAAWRLWSPHIRRVDGPPGPVGAGWTGMVKPWFGPATPMTVTWAEPGRGIRWYSTAYGHRLDYADLIEGDGHRSVITMTAEVTGPAGGVVEAVAAPVSAYGQRRRLGRLAALAEYEAARNPRPGA